MSDTTDRSDVAEHVLWLMISNARSLLNGGLMPLTDRERMRLEDLIETFTDAYEAAVIDLNMDHQNEEPF